MAFEPSLIGKTSGIARLKFGDRKPFASSISHLDGVQEGGYWDRQITVPPYVKGKVGISWRLKVT